MLAAPTVAEGAPLSAFARRLFREVAVGRAIVRGFRNAGEVTERAGNLRNALIRSGIDDAKVGIRGSAVTGVLPGRAVPLDR
jgi:hypothetical protein